MKWNNYLTSLEDNKNIPILSLEKYTPFIFSNGYLVLDFHYKFDRKTDVKNYVFADDLIQITGDEKFSFGNKYSFFFDTIIPVKIKIGDYYFNGEEWRPYVEYLENSEFYENIPFHRYDIQENKIVKATYWYHDKLTNKVIILTYWEYMRMLLRDFFPVIHTNNEKDPIYNTWKRPDNQVSYKLDLQDSIQGMLIPLPDFPLTGKMEFEMKMPKDIPGYVNLKDGDRYFSFVNVMHLKDLKLMYTHTKDRNDLFSDERTESDIVYSNVIDEENVIEAEDITLKINTYAQSIASYSSCVVKGDQAYRYLETLYSPIESGNYIPEQILINKLCDHYSAKRFIYKNTLNRKNIDFLSRIRENTLNKVMLVDAMDIDYSRDTCSVTLAEV